QAPVVALILPALYGKHVIEQQLAATQVLLDQKRRQRQVLADGVEAAVVGVLGQGAGDKGTGMLGRRVDLVEADAAVGLGGVGSRSRHGRALGGGRAAEGGPAVA